jgi:hypothetical protein
VLVIVGRVVERLEVVITPINVDSFLAKTDAKIIVFCSPAPVFVAKPIHGLKILTVHRRYAAEI